MPRSRRIRAGRPLWAALLFFAAALTLYGSSKGPPRRPYHLELEAYPAAPFPFFQKFGTIELHVYPQGVRADSFWLTGFSRNGTRTVTIMNPVARMYADMPISEITSLISKASSSDSSAESAPPVVGPITGRVGTVKASRYRLMYGPQAWIDLWMTGDVPENAQLRSIVDSLVRGVSPATAAITRGIPGTPVYVELNFRRFRKTPFLRLKRLTWNDAGQDDALRLGSFYMKAPLVDSIWR